MKEPVTLASLVVLGLLISGCGKPEATSSTVKLPVKRELLIGTWEEQPPGKKLGGASMRFSKDGSLYAVLPSGQIPDQGKGAWRVEGDETLVLLGLEENAEGVKYDFTVTETELVLTPKVTNRPALKLKRSGGSQQN